MKQLGWIILLMTVQVACTPPVPMEQTTNPPSNAENWKVEVEKTLNQFGHRNWIVIADAAYPQQSNPAIKTIAVDADQLEVVDFVNESINQSKHVTATILLDKELEFVTEDAAKGIEAYRSSLAKLWDGKPTKSLLHEDIIRELDQSANLFDILIIKTNLTIPYTSVFFQLECGYWDAEDEQQLRKDLIKK